MAQTRELALMKVVLLRGLDVPVNEENFLDAFERHQLLAIRFHRAANIDAAHDPSIRERGAWRLYFEEHVPRATDKDALLLWEYWRTTLLKDETPGSGVVITHGSPYLHWTRTSDGRLCVDLESMRDDFTGSVESLMRLLESDATRRQASVEWFAERAWGPLPLSFGGPGFASVESVTASNPRGRRS
jgi:hypothetical protein